MIGGQNVIVFMLMCVACHNMGHCYVKLSQFDTAEEAFSQALSIFTAIHPQGCEEISIGGTTVLRQLLFMNITNYCFCS